ncbi:hypothetical protein ZIOFF_069779 [Zingiber officinale]|uniref:Uncharacterized protein n=1 Tax=Zingiber officinale TaxID=94328 RepID=A0A8J5CBN9_ZINOF|nr:hypothetical protein ZIOFF_069779 [Zingiber officinale]
MHNLQRTTGRLRRQLTRQQSSQYTLEQQLDPQVQLRLSMQERASIVPVEVSNHSRRDDVHHRVYAHRSEEVVLITDGGQLDKSFNRKKASIASKEAICSMPT